MQRLETVEQLFIASDFLLLDEDTQIDQCFYPTCIDLEPRYRHIFSRGIFCPRSNSFRMIMDGQEFTVVQFFSGKIEDHDRWEIDVLSIALVKNPYDVTDIDLDPIGVRNALLLSDGVLFAAKVKPPGVLKITRPIRSRYQADMQHSFFRFSGILNRATLLPLSSLFVTTVISLQAKTF